MRRHKQPLPANIHTRLKQAQEVLANNPQVVFAYLFGGLSQGEPKPLSDVDIAVYLEDGANALTTKLQLIGAITHVLGIDEVDVVILNEASLSLVGRIQQSARVLVDKDHNRRLAYESLIRREFADVVVQEQKILYRRFGLGR